MSFTKIILISFFVISTLSTQTLIRGEIDLGFHCFYLEITWKIHGILCHKRSGNPVSVFIHFVIFITKMCMKESTWNLAHKKTCKNLEFRSKNLEKTWNLVFGKMWEPSNKTNLEPNIYNTDPITLTIILKLTIHHLQCRDIYEL